jgi:hypothetical protein
MEGKELRRLRAKRRLLWKRAAEVEEFLRGSVVLMKRRCIFAGCRKCASGERHPTWVLTVNQKGKTQTVYVGKRRLAEARVMVENYRRIKALLEEVAQINLVLFRRKDLTREGAEHGRRGQIHPPGRGP